MAESLSPLRSDCVKCKCEVLFQLSHGVRVFLYREIEGKSVEAFNNQSMMLQNVQSRDLCLFILEINVSHVNMDSLSLQ